MNPAVIFPGEPQAGGPSLVQAEQETIGISYHLQFFPKAMGHPSWQTSLR